MVKKTIKYVPNYQAYILKYKFFLLYKNTNISIYTKIFMLPIFSKWFINI